MRSRRFLPLAAVLVLAGVLLAGVAMMTVAALPAVLAVGMAVLALVAGVGTRRRRWSERRAHATTAPADVDPDAPTVGTGTPPVSWTVRWDSPPPVQMLPETRERVAVMLAEWGLTGEAAEPTLLVVTELLSNALEHAGGPEWLSLTLADDAVHVRVRDHGSEQPNLRPLDPAQVRGRGLQLVDALSSDWGWTGAPRGTVVWAEVPTRWPT